MEIGQKQLGFDIETQPQWIGKNEFPFTGTISNVSAVKGKYGKIDYRITLENPQQFKVREFDLWGDNLAYMVNTFGTRADDWLGKDITVSRDSDLKRKVARV